MVPITKEKAKVRLGNVAEEKRFWVADGRYLSNLEDLMSALDTMTDEIFRTHSNESKSDFAIWVNEVIGDDKLSRDLKKSPTRQTASKNVAARIKFLEAKKSN